MIVIEEKIKNSDQPSYERWGMFCHLSAFAACIVPFGHILGPFLVWHFNKHKDPLIDACGKSALNFQLSITLYIFICPLIFLFCVILFPLLFLFIFVAIFFGLLWAVLVIYASLKASNAEVYIYPFSLKFLK